MQPHAPLSRLSWSCAVGVLIQDACNSNASFDFTTDQLLSAISEMEKAKEVVKV